MHTEAMYELLNIAKVKSRYHFSKKLICFWLFKVSSEFGFCKRFIVYIVIATYVVFCFTSF
jgi:hypothetical protein